MPGKVTLKIVGNWKKEIETPLRNALFVSMDILGNSGETACRKALFFMAQSAGKLARPATRRKSRQIQRDAHGRPYVDVYVQGNADPYKVFKWMFQDSRGKQRIPGQWANARKIGSVGLAQRSWLWGLKRFGRGGNVRTPIPGTSRVYTIRGKAASGYVKANMLGYIQKALPRGWESMVQASATNKIMGQARRKMENEWRRRMGMPNWKKGMAMRSADDLSRYFLKAG